MLSEQTLSILNGLKLFGMARGFSERLSHPHTAELSHEEFFGLLVQEEKTYRENLRLKRLLKNSKLKQPAAVEDIDTKHPRGSSKYPKKLNSLGDHMRVVVNPQHSGHRFPDKTEHYLALNSFSGKDLGLERGSGAGNGAH